MGNRASTEKFGVTYCILLLIFQILVSNTGDSKNCNAAGLAVFAGDCLNNSPKKPSHKKHPGNMSCC